MGICRLCLASAEMDMFFEDRRLFLDKFLMYTNLKIIKNDNYPQHICLTCLQKVEAIVAFVAQCEKTDRILRSHTKDVPSTIYNEFIDGLKSFKVDDSDESRDDDNESLRSFDDAFDTNFSEEDKGPLKKRLKKDLEEELVIEKMDYLCNVCGEHFDNGQRLGFSRHMATHREKDYQCDMCPRKFRQKNAFDNHKMLHDTGQLLCKVCHKQFPELNILKKHMLYTHQTRKYPCEVCFKVFTRPDTLKTHKKKHTSSKKIFSCDYCQKEFVTKQGLITHVRNHTGERPFACRYCDSRFSDRGYLPIHERLHTGQSPHKCPICFKSFAQIGNMKSHFKFNHREFNYKESLKLYRKTQELLKSSTNEVISNE